MRINRLLKLLWTRKGYIFGIPAIAMACLFLFYQSASEKYSSTAVVATNLSQVSDSETQIIDLVDMMQSDIALDLLSYKLLLHDLKTSQKPFRHVGNNEFKQTLQSYPDIYYDIGDGHEELVRQLVEKKLKNFERLKREGAENDLIADILKIYRYHPQYLRKNLNIIRSAGQDLLSVSYASGNPQLSAFAVNSFAREFIRYYENAKISQNAPSKLSSVLHEKKQALEDKKRRLNELKFNENDVVNLDYNVSQLKEFSLKRDNLLDEIRSLRLQIESTDKKIKEAGKANMARASNARILQLQDKINQINQLYINSGSSNKELEKTLQDLRAELRHEMNKVSSSNREAANVNVGELQSRKEELELQLRIARTNLTSIENNIASLNESVSGMTDVKSEINALEKEVETAMNEYVAALNDFEQESKQSPLRASLTILSPGIPEAPQQKHTALAYTMTGSAAMIFTIFFIVLSYIMDSRLRNPARFKRKTHLRLGGVINEINSDKIDLSRLFSSEQDNEHYEAFKHLLRKVRNEIQSDKNDKVFLFTSLKSGEGKSFLILCLAYSLSLLNKKVLIIDTNFKNNTLTRTLSPEAVETNLLELKRKLITDPNFGQPPIPTEDEELLQAFNPEFIEESASPVIAVHENIGIIGSKQVNQSPSEIFAGKNFENLLHELAFQYDYIFMEGPALNDFSDSSELAAYADKIVPVFSARSAIKQSDRESIAYLKRLNNKLSTAVLNNVEIEDLNN